MGPEVHIGGLGWANLAHAHNLGLGYFLIFQYQGNIVFDFKAFDLITCEIAYPSIVEWVAKKLKQREPILIHVEDEEERSEEEEERRNFSNVLREASTGDKEKQLMKSNAMRFLNIPARLIHEPNGLWEQEELRLKDPKGRGHGVPWLKVGGPILTSIPHQSSFRAWNPWSSRVAEANRSDNSASEAL
ncbi:uncharacterized protein A4U43_C02F14040 [Asparagus officinalis]|uniref:Uncharacterized protein n=1 Tax=Asparagus officinalis TaxID=4686 RepID=A0A5P1FID6_ASPOF|nr:uncharacterized protein A4U43_C02F14040 [Asparagus officinalis]